MPLCTGGSSGVGRAVVSELTRMGVKVYTGCRRFEAAGTVIDDLQKKGLPIKGQLNASYMDLAGEAVISTTVHT